MGSQALFALLWGNITNTWCVVQDAAGNAVSRGASASADWAANRRITLPRMLGRALAIAGWGSGLTDRALGGFFGEEAHALSSGEMPAHGHGAGTLAAPAHTHSVPNIGGATYVFDGGGSAYTTAGVPGTSGSAGSGALTGSTASAGSGAAHNIMQPTSFLNVMIKL